MVISLGVGEGCLSPFAEPSGEFRQLDRPGQPDGQLVVAPMQRCTAIRLQTLALPRRFRKGVGGAAAMRARTISWRTNGQGGTLGRLRMARRRTFECI